MAPILIQEHDLGQMVVYLGYISSQYMIDQTEVVRANPDMSSWTSESRSQQGQRMVSMVSMGRAVRIRLLVFHAGSC